MSRQSEEYAAAFEALKASRGFGVQSSKEEQWQAAGQMIKDHYNDKELREKALMYAIQAASFAVDPFDVVDTADKYLGFLRGGAA